MNIRFVAAVVVFSMVTAAFAGKNSTFNLDGDQAKMLKQYVTVKNPKALTGIKKVAISQFQVEYVTNTSACATAYATKNSSNSATVSCSYALKNVDTAQFQALTDKLYGNLVEEFKVVGIEVMPQKDLAADETYQKLTKKPNATPFDVKTMDGRSQFYSATGIPFYFDQNDKRMGLGNMFASQFSNFNPASFESKIAKKNNIAVVKVRVVVTFANMEAKGGWWRDVASVGTKLKVTLIPEFTKITIVTPKGTAVEQVKSPVFADGVFLTEVSSTLTTGDKVANALSGVAGAIGGTSSKTLKYDAKADANAYSTLIEKHVAAIDKLFFTFIKK